MIVYHGSTNTEIKEFRLKNSYGVNGVFFSDSFELAKDMTYNTPKGVYKCEINPNNLIELDAKGEPFNDLKIEGLFHISELAEKYYSKCDCLKIKNVFEHGRYVVTDYIVFDTNIIKILEQI